MGHKQQYKGYSAKSKTKKIKITYCSLLVQIVKTKRGSNNTLKSLNPSLSNVLLFGTGGEKALVTGFTNNFDRATHILCDLHLKAYVETKLQEFGIIGKTKESIITDIFGRRIGSLLEKDLVDASSKDVFEEQLWQLDGLHGKGRCFHGWFQKHKSGEIINCDKSNTSNSRTWLSPREVYDP